MTMTIGFSKDELAARHRAETAAREKDWATLADLDAYNSWAAEQFEDPGDRVIDRDAYHLSDRSRECNELS